MANDESEGDRVRKGTASARRSLIIIYGVGFVAIGVAIALVLKSVPAGTGNGYGEPVPNDVRESAGKLCKKFGDPCQFAPGILGTCIAKQNCATGDCLFCQSSH